AIDEIIVIVVRLAVMDMCQIGGELVIGDRVPVRFIFGHRRPLQQNGLPREPVSPIVPVRGTLPLLGAVPVVDILANLILGNAVALLDLALDLLALAAA